MTSKGSTICLPTLVSLLPKKLLHPLDQREIAWLLKNKNLAHLQLSCNTTILLSVRVTILNKA